MEDFAEVLSDLSYLGGVTPTEAFDAMPEDYSNLEALYTLQELKELLLHRLMEEEDKS